MIKHLQRIVNIYDKNKKKVFGARYFLSKKSFYFSKMELFQ